MQHIKTFLVISALIVAFNIQAQTVDQKNDSATIGRLNFPYRKGYHMHFKGETTVYDYQHKDPDNGDPGKITVNSELIYYINDQQTVDNDTIVNFAVTGVHGLDTTNTLFSPLMVNGDGMFYWMNFSKQDAAAKDLKKLKKSSKTTQFNPVKTPMKKGDEWRSVDYNLTSTVFTCISTDTVISTKLGDLHTFAVRSTSVRNDQGNFIVMDEITDYYAQGIGKIQTIEYTYAINKDTNEEMPLVYDIITLKKTWWDGDDN